jgi:transposase
MCSEDGDVPLLAQTIAGNSSDKTHFLETVKSLKKQILEGDTAPYYLVADSALYTANTLQEMSGTFKWITRVPEKLTEGKRLLLDIAKEEMTHLYDGYFFKEVHATYANVPQRWLIVYSKQAYEKEKATLERGITKELEEQNKVLRRLTFQDFDCECDARSALTIFEKKLKYLAIANLEIHCRNVKTGKGRPRKDVPLTTKYRIQATLAPDQEKIALYLRTKGKFIVATNELDDKKLSPQEILDTYKGQQGPERGFRFLKDSSFMTSSIFLKNQDRIVALGMIMCLCLLVYTIAQRYLRMQLKKMHSTVPNQKGKPTDIPTMRWIFQLFEGVHLLIHKTRKSVTEMMLNLNPIRLYIIDILGEPFREMYKNIV